MKSSKVYMRYKKQMDSKSLREVLRLMQLGLLESSRWCSITRTQPSEMLDTIDVRRVEGGVIRTMYKDRLDPLKQQVVDAMRSTFDLMTQMGGLGEVISAGVVARRTQYLVRFCVYE